MSDQKLPNLIDPTRFADKEAQVEGIVDIQAFSRLASFLHEATGQVSVSLKFSRNDQNVVYIEGCAKANLLLICQRCLQGVSYPVEAQFVLSPVPDDEHAKQLPNEYEPVLMQDRLISLHDVIEDELLLNLPMVAMHNGDHCSK